MSREVRRAMVLIIGFYYLRFITTSGQRYLMLLMAAPVRHINRIPNHLSLIQKDRRPAAARLLPEYPPCAHNTDYVSSKPLSYQVPGGPGSIGMSSLA